MTRSTPTHSAPTDHRAIASGIRVLTTYPVALPPELAAVTELASRERKWTSSDCLDPSFGPVSAATKSRGWLSPLLDRLRVLRHSWRLLKLSQGYSAVVTTGDLEGLAFGALLRLRGGRRPVHVMYDCLWYGGSGLRRAWIRFCLAGVDRCIVWASIEQDRYARAYGMDRSKFAYVPHHHTLKNYRWEPAEEQYVFTGGNADRDFAPFFAAVRGLDIPCVLATNRPGLLKGLDVPSNVRIVSVSAAEFRQLMARSRIVVMPMRASLLHAGAQQSVLNAMLMGKPVILTDPEGGADYIDSGSTGTLVPYGDVTALRGSIRYLWENPAAARDMGARAQTVASTLTVEHCNFNMWRIALRLINERRNTVPERSRERAGLPKEPASRAESV